MGRKLIQSRSINHDKPSWVKLLRNCLLVCKTSGNVLLFSPVDQELKLHEMAKQRFCHWMPGPALSMVPQSLGRFHFGKFGSGINEPFWNLIFERRWNWEKSFNWQSEIYSKICKDCFVPKTLEIIALSQIEGRRWQFWVYDLTPGSIIGIFQL